CCTPRDAATTAAAATARASPAGPATAASARTAAEGAAAAALGILLAGLVEPLLVENVERPQIDVRKFLFAEVDLGAECCVTRRHIRSLISDARRVCTAHEGHRGADDSHNRCGLLQVFLV